MWHVESRGLSVGGMQLISKQHHQRDHDHHLDRSTWRRIADPCDDSTGDSLAVLHEGEHEAMHIAGPRLVVPWVLEAPAVHGENSTILVRRNAMQSISVISIPATLDGLRYMGAAHAGGAVQLHGGTSRSSGPCMESGPGAGSRVVY